MSEYEYSALTVSCESCNKRNTIVGSIPEFEIVNCSGCGKPMGQLRALMASSMSQAHEAGAPVDEAGTPV
ncbi:MAG: hypothetical protein CML29_01355 [Rhizobiales bacterium]|nr:hypothetical protein [Hyphomicrobiales bacterium]MBA70310.1 hypothetical protein [Hyphomicrobiales bacterium]|tara:strand:- start:895 stop:1104 length:210 start_codon:yes stop_codon:yes gene_type:complete